MLAIIQAIQTWIQTNQCNLNYWLEQRIVTLKQQKWVTKLLGYDYKIIYKLDRENNTTNVLSKVAGSLTLDVLFMPKTLLWDTIKTEACDHLYMQKIGKLAIENSGIPYTWCNRSVCYKSYMGVPPNSSII